MKLMVWDTETSGLPDWKQPSGAPQQPHLCEIAAGLCDESGSLLDQYHAYVRPDGWDIDPAAYEAHKLSVEFLMDCGRPERDVWREFHEFQEQADIRIGHNESFDARIARIGFKRFGVGEADGFAADADHCDMIADAFKVRPAMCTMRLATPIIQLPATEAMKAKGMRFKYKNPSLTECHEYFFGTPFEGAHGAMADMEACAKVFFHMLNKGFISLPAIA